MDDDKNVPLGAHNDVRKVYAIPFLTALGDLLGTGLLSLGFYIMWHFGDKDTDVGE